MNPAIANRDGAVVELARGWDLLAELRRVLSAAAGVGGGGDGAASLAEEAARAIASAIDALREGVEEAAPAGGGKRTRREAGAATKRQRRSKATFDKTIVSTNLEDGYLWRKYGQKIIQNAKYPRNYFRCSRRFSHGCQAIRQVQKDKDDPSLFEITYIDKHTCMDCFKSKSISSKQRCMINFESIDSLEKECNDILYRKELSSEYPLQSMLNSPETSLIKTTMIHESDMVSEQEDATSSLNREIDIIEDPYIASICNFKEDTYGHLDI